MQNDDAAKTSDQRLRDFGQLLRGSFVPITEVPHEAASLSCYLDKLEDERDDPLMRLLRRDPCVSEDRAVVFADTLQVVPLNPRQQLFALPTSGQVLNDDGQRFAERGMIQGPYTKVVIGTAALSGVDVGSVNASTEDRLQGFNRSDVGTSHLDRQSRFRCAGETTFTDDQSQRIPQRERVHIDSLHDDKVSQVNFTTAQPVDGYPVRFIEDATLFSVGVGREGFGIAYRVNAERVKPGGEREQPPQPAPAHPRPLPADDRRTDDQRKTRPGEQVKGEPNRQVRPQ